MPTLQESIDFLLVKNPQAHLDSRPDGGWLEAPGIDVAEMAQHMAAAEAQLSTVTAIARPDGETTLIYHYRLGSRAINIKTCTRENRMPSIAPFCLAANWIEREIHDLFSVTFTGHPNPARLIRPPELAPGFFREPGGKQSRTS